MISKKVSVIIAGSIAVVAGILWAVGVISPPVGAIVIFLTALAEMIYIFYYDNNKKPDDVKPEPVEPDKPDVPDIPDVPDTPDVPTPDDPDKPDDEPEPDKPDDPDKPQPDDPVDPEPDKPDDPEPDQPDEPDDEPEPEPLITAADEARIEYVLTLCRDQFKSVLDLNTEGVTYPYIKELIREAYVQYFKGASLNGLPLLYVIENFPFIYNYYGDKINEDAAFKTCAGWLYAMQLAEVYPRRRTKLYKVGYSLGGYTMNDNLYGYEFRSDPNVARLVASAIYSALHSVLNPDIDAMRTETGGTAYTDTLSYILENYSKTAVGKSDFYIDLREFMNSAPGPYSPSYSDRSGINPTWPDQKASNKNLQVDVDVYNHVVENCNLDEQHAVQAIADEDANPYHMFDTDKTNVCDKWNFNADFGPNSIGELIKPNKEISDFVFDNLRAGSNARRILQHADNSVGHYEYGRMRPGCDENREGRRKSYTDDRLNVLANFWIQDNDGNKEVWYKDGYQVPYYDANGHWTNKEVQSAEEFESQQKDLLYANSYPSGHSSGMWGAASAMMELYPYKADLIMREANWFAVNRTIARYHWNSDTIQGRVLASAMAPVTRATAGYYDRFAKAKKEAETTAV